MKIALATCLELPEPDHDEAITLEAFRQAGQSTGRRPRTERRPKTPAQRSVGIARVFVRRERGAGPDQDPSPCEPAFSSQPVAPTTTKSAWVQVCPELPAWCPNPHVWRNTWQSRVGSALACWDSRLRRPCAGPRFDWMQSFLQSHQGRALGCSGALPLFQGHRRHDHGHPWSDLQAPQGRSLGCSDSPPLLA